MSMPKNKYQHYRISQSLNGDEIVYLARFGKQKELIGRASSEEKLVAMMVEEAKKIEDALAAQKEAAIAATETSMESKKKKKSLGLLWEPGSLIKDKKVAADESNNVDALSEPVTTATANTRTNLNVESI